MKLSREQLKKLIEEEAKKIMEGLKKTKPANGYDRKSKNIWLRLSGTPVGDSYMIEDKEKEAPVITPTKPVTKPQTPTRPLKIPDKWPGPMPKPLPKAKSKKNISENKNIGINFVVENERMKQLISEAPMNVDPSDLGGPHPSIKSGIEGRKTTPFSAVELFNTRAMDQSAIEKLGSEEYNAIIRNVLDTEVLGMMQIMNTYQLIVRLEHQHLRALENLSLAIVQQKFGLPDDVIDRIKASLVKDGEIDPPDSDSPEEEVMAELTPEQQAVVKKHLDKRIIHNALMMGAGYRAHAVFDSIKNSLDAIDDKLYPLYRKIMPNMELFMWKAPVEEMFGQRMVMGKSELDIQPDGKMQAKAEATMFPILLHEVAKAAVEILFAQHLVDLWEKHGEAVYKTVMKQSESYLDEHWMKLIGPRLWKYLHDAIDYVVQERGNDYTIVAYVLNRMAIMEPEDFMALMDDVLHRGQEAIQKIKNMIDEIETDIENAENANGETPSPEELEAGEENHSQEISDLLKSNEDELLAKGPEEKPKPIKKRLKDMDITELNNALGNAIEAENYELAGKIRDEINRR